MAAPKELRNLVDIFDRNIEDYKSGRFNEAQVRQQFIDPFFEILGWDVANKQGWSEAYKEVVHEDSVKIANKNKAPDYGFRIGRERKFFVEAKKPSVDVKNDPAPAYQVRRYAWSAKLPLSIVTDFEEFAVYDCRVKPARKDKSSAARVKYLRYTDYADQWDYIEGLFSKDAILKGAFDRYAESHKAKRGTAEVDDAFLDEIELWREVLAKNLHKNNTDLDTRALNYAVQATIDRIIFLRICEDRGIEPYGRLEILQNGANVYGRLFDQFREADQRYNSGLFHFRNERGRTTAADQLTPHLKLDDKPLKEIMKGLYYPVCPYEFSMLSADILGQVYERFLGNVITITGRRAKIEQKPEVRKAGGVYYTPTYIVDYIVKNTVGKLLENKTARKAVSIKICDPACGSGSFLMGAYQYLLDWYLDWYVNHQPRKYKKAVIKVPPKTKGEVPSWHLTLDERKRILLNNIYGVDIDSQAVEVTKLSLLLKVLEDREAIQPQQELAGFKERLLPDLDENIRCGNSLIGSDFYAQGELELTEEDQYRINVFDWDGPDGFPEVMRSGGFDVVIGNPPYSYRNATEELAKPYYPGRYKTAEGNYETYKFFIERSTTLAKGNGIVGFIVSASFLVQKSFSKLRKLILEMTKILELAPLGPKAFKQATVDTVVLILSPKSPGKKHRICIRTPVVPEALSATRPYFAAQSRFRSNTEQIIDYRLSEVEAKFVSRLFNKHPNLDSQYEVGVGINTGYIRTELVSHTKTDKRFHPLVLGRGISRFGSVKTVGWIMYDPDYVKSRGKFGRSLPPENFFKAVKILVVRTRNISLERRIIATVDKKKKYNLNRLSNIISRNDSNIYFLLGILNSRLLNWLFQRKFFDYEIKPHYLRQIPIPIKENSDLIRLVQQILALHESLEKSSYGQHNDAVQRNISILETQIDKKIYQIYNLTDKEIAMVEDA